MDFVDHPFSGPALHAEECTAIANRTPAAFSVNTFRATVGPGWFESSRDLKRGLTVLEGLPAELALNDWLKNNPYGW